MLMLRWVWVQLPGHHYLPFHSPLFLFNKSLPSFPLKTDLWVHIIRFKMCNQCPMLCGKCLREETDLSQSKLLESRAETKSLFNSQFSCFFFFFNLTILLSCVDKTHENERKDEERCVWEKDCCAAWKACWGRRIAGTIWPLGCKHRHISMMVVL